MHVGLDLEEQQELLECLLAFVLQFLLADDTVTCLLPGQHILSYFFGFLGYLFLDIPPED